MMSSNRYIFRVTDPCAGNSLVTGDSPHKGQWRGALMFSLICALTNGWVNNRDAGDLRRRRAHYDVTVMVIKSIHVDFTKSFAATTSENEDSSYELKSVYAWCATIFLKSKYWSDSLFECLMLKPTYNPANFFSTRYFGKMQRMAFPSSLGTINTNQIYSMYFERKNDPGLSKIWLTYMTIYICMVGTYILDYYMYSSLSIYH